VQQKQLFVRPAADEKAQLQPVTDFVKTLPAYEQRGLKAEGAPATTTTAPTTAAPTGHSWPTGQAPPASGGVAAGDVVAVVKQNHEAKYPLPSQLRKQRETTHQGA
jgi:hypothetical protein